MNDDSCIRAFVNYHLPFLHFTDIAFAQPTADDDDLDDFDDLVDDYLIEKGNLWSDGPLSILKNIHDYVTYRLVTCLTHCIVCDRVRVVQCI